MISHSWSLIHVALLSDCVIQNVMFFLPLDSELLRADALPCGANWNNEPFYLIEF